MTIDQTVAAPQGRLSVNLWSHEFNADFWGGSGRCSRAPLGAHRQGDTTCYFVTGFDDVRRAPRLQDVLVRGRRRHPRWRQPFRAAEERGAVPPRGPRPSPADRVAPPAQPVPHDRPGGALQSAVIATFDELLAPPLARTPPVMDDFLRPLQLMVFSEILNLPGRQADEWMAWSHDLLVGESPEVAGAAFVSINQAADDCPRTHGRPDSRRRRQRGQHRRRDRRPGTHVRRAHRSRLPLAIAGTESVGTVLGGMVHHLATHPDDLAEFVTDPSLVPAAVEEGLRMFANVTALQRTVTAPAALAGVPLEHGDKVWVSYNGANRDAAPSRTPTPLGPPPRRGPPRRVQRRPAPLDRRQPRPPDDGGHVATAAGRDIPRSQPGAPARSSSTSRCPLAASTSSRSTSTPRSTRKVDTHDPRREPPTPRPGAIRSSPPGTTWTSLVSRRWWTPTWSSCTAIAGSRAPGRDSMFLPPSNR